MNNQVYSITIEDLQQQARLRLNRDLSSIEIDDLRDKLIRLLNVHFTLLMGGLFMGITEEQTK
jgi:hypothetical protein